ncbi:MAG: GspE/PulE family protein [Planctomycetales bacterium]
MNGPARFSLPADLTPSTPGPVTTAHWFRGLFAGRVTPQQNDIPAIVEQILSAARDARATDVHLQPTEVDWEMRWRIDSVLQEVARFPLDVGRRIVTRLKVLAELLTYRVDLPQEGRVRSDLGANETRISCFPTIFGEKVVIRLFVGSAKYQHVADLGFPADLRQALTLSLSDTGGIILVTGPAGSGKTTSLYACLRELSDRHQGGRNLVSLEDPVEVIVPGVTQSQVNSHAGFDLETGLRSLLRQDPEVIMVGEIRDQTVARVVFQAALSGHLVLTTFHAGHSIEALCRLGDLGIEPFLLRNAIRLVLGQRLVRKLCTCATPPQNSVDGIASRMPVGCAECAGTGYQGRLVLVEGFSPGLEALRPEFLQGIDPQRLATNARAHGFQSLRDRGLELVRQGETSLLEVYRVLGTLAEPPASAT